jgi:hypothetical protein
VADFQPHLGETLCVGTSCFGFMPHPYLPAEMQEVYAVEGGEAVTYQLQDLSTAALWALKVSKGSYRGEHIARSVAALAPYAALPGLYVCNRLCLTRETAPEVVAQYPDLEYALLMPWIIGKTWAGFLGDRALGETYTIYQAADLALATAQMLWNLEAYNLAHTDIAGGNVVISPDFKGVELLDIDNIFRSDYPPPRRYSRGSPGYQHRRLGPKGQWCAEGDRFAGAILLVEMLSWWDPRVRALTPAGAESLFQPDELQEVGAPRWSDVRDALWAVCPQTLSLFDQAWGSPSLEQCPELSTWAMALVQAPR